MATSTYNAENITGYMRKSSTGAWPPTVLNKFLDNSSYVGQLISGTTETKYPVSNGAYIEWDGQYPDSDEHWDKVDDTTIDNDETYIYSETLGDRDLFDLTSVNLPVYSRLRVYVYPRQTGSGGQIQIMIRTHDTDYFSPTITPTTSYASNFYSWFKNPFTDDYWTKEELDALQIGVKVVTAPTTGQIRVTRMFAYADAGYHLYRGVMSFDTSPIPEDATLTSAKLKLAMTADNSTVDFDMRFYSGINQWTGTDDLGWDDCAVDEGIFFNTAGKEFYKYYEHSVLITSITKTGRTQFRLISEREGTPPTENEYVIFARYDDPLYGPILEVTWIAFRVSTDACDQIQNVSARGNGSIDDLGSGGVNCDERGFVYDATSHGDPGDVSPSSSDYPHYVYETGSFTAEDFNRIIPDLTKGRVYYVRAYAHSDTFGYQYGEEITFIAGRVEREDTLIADFDDGEHHDTETRNDNLELDDLPEDTESFETDFGNWPNATGNDQDWWRDSGGTPSGGTGPSAAYEGDYYIYVECSAGYAFEAGDISIVEYDLISQKDGYVDFYYHQLGSHQGTLYLEGYDGSWHEIWSSTGNQGNQWNHVTTPDTNFSSYTKLRFRNVAAGNYAGDVALDLIKVYTETSYKTSGTFLSTILDILPLSSCEDGKISWSETLNGQNFSVYSRYNITSPSLKSLESFEQDFNFWTGVIENDEDWRRHSGGTPSGSTGPSGAYEGTYYIYVETSDGYAYSDGDISIIEHILGALKSGYVDFYYHQYGADQGTLYLEGYDGTWHEIWSSGGNQGDVWKHVTTLDTDFSNYSKLRFRNVAAGGYRGDVSLDLVKVQTDSEAVDDFETVPSWDWPNVAGNDIDWIRLKDKTPSLGTGPDSALDEDYYIYIETTGSVSGDVSTVEYDVSDPGEEKHVDFYYHQKGIEQGTLYLEGYDGSWHEIWKSKGDHGDQWIHITTPQTNFRDYTKLRFRNVAAGGYRGDIALDLIKIYEVDWSDWALCTSGDYIPDLFSLSPGKLIQIQYKVEMSGDGVSTPQLHDIIILCMYLRQAVTIYYKVIFG